MEMRPSGMGLRGPNRELGCQPRTPSNRGRASSLPSRATPVTIKGSRLDYLTPPARPSARRSRRSAGIGPRTDSHSPPGPVRGRSAGEPFDAERNNRKRYLKLLRSSDWIKAGAPGRDTVPGLSFRPRFPKDRSVPAAGLIFCARRHTFSKLIVYPRFEIPNLPRC